MRQEILGIVCVLALTSGIDAADRYEQWLKEEVVWIIGADEKKAFEALRDGAAKDQFIEEFWRIRDPVPETPANEYREEHARRLKYAVEHFREGSTPGWKTDRGRVYIIHGPPLGRNLQQDTELWSYNHNPYAEYYQGPMTLVFSRSGAVFQQRALSESKMGQERAQMYDRGPRGVQDLMATSQRMRLVSAGPGVGRGGAILTSSGETDRYIADWLRSPGDALTERRKEAQRRQEAWQELKETVIAQAHFGGLPLTLQALNFLVESEWHVAFTAELDAGAVEFQAVDDVQQAKVDVFCEALGPADGGLADRLDETLTYSKMGDQPLERLIFANHFRLPAGSYRLACWFQDVRSRKAGGAEVEVDLADPTSGEVILSSLLLTQTVEPAGSEPGQGLVFQGIRFLPRRPGPVDRAEPLYAYFELYPAAEAGEGARYVYDYKLYTDEEVFLRVPQQPLPLEPGARISPMALMFDLSKLPDGNYHFLLKVMDTSTRKFTMRLQDLRLGCPDC